MKNPKNCCNASSSAYARLLQALEVETQREASLLLGIPQSRLSDCKRRGGPLCSALLQAAVQRGIARDWLVYGSAPMRLPRHQKEDSLRGAVLP